MAADRPTPARVPEQPRLGRLYLGLLAAVVAAVVLDAISGIDIKIENEFILLGVFYIVAQAVERLVEPLLAKETVAPQTEDKKAELGKAKVALASAESAVEAQGDAKAAQEALTAAQQQRARAGWALASIFALIACGALGLGLIESVSTVTVEGGKSDRWLSLFSAVDIVVTGLAVGAGTKPLHDLITRIEKSKEKADPATNPAVAR